MSEARRVQRTYLLLTLLSTLAASFIWGINTLFLLDAGLSNAEAFAANAFFTAGQVLFEIPTGVVADTWGRRTSYLLGTLTLLVSTLLYVAMWWAHAPMWGWAISSILLGLGFTFFSGATEAWLVDALTFHGARDTLESVLARGQTMEGAAMLIGSVVGGVVAQLTHLGVPYVLRSVLLGVTLAVAFVSMKDLGFTPERGKGPLETVRAVVRGSLDHGLRNPPARWLMLSAPFTMGVAMFSFYAFQPYLLQLYGDTRAFWIAGLAAAIVAGCELVAGLIAPHVRTLFSRRTHGVLVATALGAGCLALIGWTTRFWVAIAALVVSALAQAATRPMRQAYLNGVIPSGQRATVLSFDNLMGSAGGVVVQPVLGRVSDVSGYASAYVVSAAIQAMSLPFLVLARREHAPPDRIGRE
ncbi:nitrate/nitrite transporter NarK [Archangium gephyra]|uniref:Nitrate/nitrite transporter NarK n=1 Tax=Archangium gephyra TaxID=48 RepID=A0AAC8QDK9_9BACT|nr:MFS transporter [Archangium gephyra]AKJ05479.1 transport protein [Archangium gephyra]REG36162.1 nitrate/nitrite transporter NarK [Archangium gephyra]